MKTKLLILLLLLCLTNLASAQGPKIGVTLNAINNTQLTAIFDVPKGLNLYQDMISFAVIEPKSLVLEKPQFPKGHAKKDAYTGEERIVYKETTSIPIAIKNRPSQALNARIEVSYQACTEEACLLPQVKEFTVDIPGDGKPSSVMATLPQATPASAPKEKSTAEGLMADWGLFGYYLAGLLLSLTPCIFPMIPITISVIGSKEGGSMTGFFRSLIYVLGMALTYAILGLAAAMSGGVVGSAMQNPYILFAVAALFFAMGLSMMDVFYLQLPNFLQSRLQGLGGKGFVGVFLTGLAAGLVASPCVTPVLVGVLLQIATEGELFLGFMKLFVFAWGLGTILIVVGTFSSALSALPRAGNWMVEVKKVLGVMLMGAAFYYLEGALPLIWFTILLGIFLVVLAVAAGATDSLPHETPMLPRFKKAGGIVSLIVGVYLLGGTLLINGLFLPPILNCSVGQGTYSPAVAHASSWIQASEEAIAKAKADGKPVILDFGAEWCAACRELEKETLSSSKVAEALKRFVTLKVDMTRPTPPTEKLRRTYNVVGFPTLIFIDSDGTVRSDMTQVGFIDADTFLDVLARVR